MRRTAARRLRLGGPSHSPTACASSSAMASTSSRLRRGRARRRRIHRVRVGGPDLARASAGCTAVLPDGRLGECSEPVSSGDGRTLAYARVMGGVPQVFVMPASEGPRAGSRSIRRRPSRAASSRTARASSSRPHGKATASSACTRSRWKEQAGDGAPAPQGYGGAFSPDGATLAYVPDSAIELDRPPAFLRGGAISADLPRVPACRARHGRDAAELRRTVPDRLGGKSYCATDRRCELQPRGLRPRDEDRPRPDLVAELRRDRVRRRERRADRIRARRADPRPRRENERVDPAAYRVRACRAGAREEAVPAARFLPSASPSPDGARASSSRRAGTSSLSVPATGAAEDLTATPGAAERLPVVSPDRRTIACFSGADRGWRSPPVPSTEGPCGGSRSRRSRSGTAASRSRRTERASRSRTSGSGSSWRTSRRKRSRSWTPRAASRRANTRKPSRRRRYPRLREGRAGRRALALGLGLGDGRAPPRDRGFPRRGACRSSTRAPLAVFGAPGARGTRPAADLDWGLECQRERRAARREEDLYLAVLLERRRPALPPGRPLDVFVGGAGTEPAPDRPRRPRERVRPRPDGPARRGRLYPGPAGTVLVKVRAWPRTAASGRVAYHLLRCDLAAPRSPVELLGRVEDVGVRGRVPSLVTGDGLRLLPTS